MLEAVSLNEFQVNAGICHLLVVFVFTLLVPQLGRLWYIHIKKLTRGPSKNILKVSVRSSSVQCVDV